MKIYKYDRDTKEFLSETDARENPKEMGKFLVPANATIEKPLNPQVGFAVCFIGDKWEYIKDNRAETYFLNSQKVIFELGDDILNDMTPIQFTDEQLFKTSKDEKIALIDSTTSSDVEAIVGDNNKQKEKLMLGNLLLRKESKGIATIDEIARLDVLDALGTQVAQLKVVGNARELQVQNLNLASYASLEEAITAVEKI